jgi:CheY-like chemotaxis protein
MTNLELGAIGEAMDNLSQIMDSSKYASETIRRLQSFSGAPSSHSDSVAFDISGTVEQALNMTKVWWKTRPEAMGASIEVIPDLESDCYVKGKESEIFEVVVNLIKNASEAMPAGGSLSIGLKNDGTNVELKVSDSGMGVSEENQRKIFMPFFTTKGFESSGMGLASSHGIVANHGGEIVLNSKEGMGATFIVKLPLAQRPLEEKRAGFVSRLKKDLCVLVADDAAPVLDTITMALKQLNQTVLIAGDGREAVEIWQNNHVDVVICDLGMPELNGWEVGMKIMEGHSEQGRPKTPFILITGWEGQKLEKDKIRAAGVDCIIEKPVEINELVMAINSVLDEDCDSLASLGG